MRVRKKRWTQNELDTNERLVTPHGANKGRWGEYFGNDNEIHAEIGLACHSDFRRRQPVHTLLFVERRRIYEYYKITLGHPL